MLVKPESFGKMETRKTLEFYGEDMLADLLSKEKEYSIQNALANHEIQDTVRAKMIDWMIEVLCSYKCTDMTFFIAVSYLDLFFKNTDSKHELNDLHLVGVSSMYLATKYEEICPLRISIMQNKISHGKFTKSEIRKKETEIIAALDFKCSVVTPLHFVEFGIEYLGLCDLLSKKLYEHIIRLTVYIAKMVCHESDLLNKYK